MTNLNYSIIKKKKIFFYYLYYQESILFVNKALSIASKG